MKRLLRAFASLLAAALVGMSPSAACAQAALRGAGLEDVQVGERALQTRIALICDGPCSLEKRSDTSFFLRGVVSDMSLDLSKRSRNINGFALTPGDEGSVLIVNTARVLEYANAKPCAIAERAATCVDLFFADAQATQARVETPKLSGQALAAAPALREGAPERLSRFAALGPPERLAPPRGANLASVRSASSAAPQLAQPPRQQASNNARISAPAQNASARFDYAAEVKTLIGKNLSPGFCASAKAELQQDAWALSSMVDVGLCEAAAGNAEEAETMLARLLEYTPDNYEAHVGRALIALQAGEKSIARRYFQDALDAPPPIEESSRIVDMMRAL